MRPAADVVGAAELVEVVMKGEIDFDAAIATPDMMGAVGKLGRILHVSYDDTAGHTFTDLPNILVNGGFRITKFTEEPVNLETAFMRLTKGIVQ